MEILSKLLIICLLFVNTLKNSDGGVLEKYQKERNKIRSGIFFPILRPSSQFQQQNDYPDDDYDDGVDANYNDYQGNGYPESRGIGNPDVTYDVPNNPNAIRFNENIQNRQTNYRFGQMPDLSQSNRNTFLQNNNILEGTGVSADYNKNLITPRPSGSMYLIKADNVGKATSVEESNEVDTIFDRFGEDSTSPVGEEEKEKVIPGLKVLKPLTKTKFVFQVEPVKPVVERASGKSIVYYIE